MTNIHETNDGPACSTCGEPTFAFTLGAPGYGKGRQCPNMHVEWLTAHGVLEGDW